MAEATIHSVLKEARVFAPPDGFAAGAHVRSLADYERLYRQSMEEPETFWTEQARAMLPWMEPFTKVLEWNEPFSKWFVGGKTNASVACVDRHLGTWRKNKAALIWEGEPGEVVTLSYAQLHREVCRAANVLTELGVKRGDRVAIYMPMI